MAKTTVAHCYSLLKRNGYRYGLVEQWIAAARRRRDYCGFADILAFHPAILGVLAIQTCAASRVSDHLHKLIESSPPRESVGVWLSAGNRLEVWGWEMREAPDSLSGRMVRVSRDIQLIRLSGRKTYQFDVTDGSEIPD